MPAALNNAEKGMVAVTETYWPAGPPVEVAEGHVVDDVTVAPLIWATTPAAVAQP